MSSWDYPDQRRLRMRYRRQYPQSIPKVRRRALFKTLIRIVFAGCLPKLSIAHWVVMLVIEPEQEVLPR
jgi:hypothetical protein